LAVHAVKPYDPESERGGNEHIQPGNEKNRGFLFERSRSQCDNRKNDPQCKADRISGELNQGDMQGTVDQCHDNEKTENGDHDMEQMQKVFPARYLKYRGDFFGIGLWRFSENVLNRLAVLLP